MAKNGKVGDGHRNGAVDQRREPGARAAAGDLHFRPRVSLHVLLGPPLRKDDQRIRALDRDAAGEGGGRGQS